MGTGASSKYAADQETEGGDGSAAAEYKDPLKERPIKLSADQQLRLETSKGVKCHKGPQAFYVDTWFPPLKLELQDIIKLEANEYAVIRNTEQAKLRNVEGEKRFFLEWNEELVLKGHAVNLGPTQYCYITSAGGEQRLLVGPKLFIPDPYETVGAKREAVTLESNMYVKVQDNSTGYVRVERGPMLVFPQPSEEFVGGRPSKAHEVDEETCLTVRNLTDGSLRQVLRGKETFLFFPTAQEEVTQVERTGGMVKLSADDYAIIRDTKEHTLRTTEGETRFFLKLHEELVQRAKVVRLSNTEFCYVNNDIGEQRIVKGPVRYVPGAYETVGKKMAAITMERQQYVKIQNKVSGEVRVERGPQTIFAEPTEAVVGGGAKVAVQVDAETAVLVRDSQGGRLYLVTDHGLYFPGAMDEIVSVQKLLRLADHEALVVKDDTGAFKYFFGRDDLRGNQPRAFFLQPYCEIVTHVWSRGRRRETRTLKITHLDMRPQFMNFEFNSRTSDNVELVLEGTFYWQIEDVQKMMTFSGDVPGDICNYARSAFIQKISRVTLKEFMDDFRKIANEIIQEDTGFYSKRGLKVHSLELSGYGCADRSTAAILQQMIQETTNRMCRTSQQESETELKLTKIHGEIEQERIRGELLAIQQEHLQQEASGAGCSEAEKAAQFLKALEEVVLEPTERVAMWKILRKNEALDVLAKGRAHVYFTPADCNLSIEDKHA